MSRPFMVRSGLWVLGLAGLSLVVGACVEQEEDKPTAEDLQYVKQNLLTTAPTPQFPINADLDGKVVYLGTDVSPTPAHTGKDIKLTHYWKVVVAPGEGWRTFTHANGPKNQGYINKDHGPVRGKYPVTQWKAGDIVRDEHSFGIPASWQHDSIEIYTGLWRRNERMPVKSGPNDGAGRVLAVKIPVEGAAKPAGPKKYIVRKSAKPVKLDGKLDEAAWKTAPSTGVFVNTLTGAPAGVQTEAKLLWDDQNLYLAFENADTDVWAKLDKRDDKLWTQEAVEVMIDANGDGKSYVEFQVAPNQTIFDTYLPTYRKYEDSIDPKRKPFDWNSKLKAAVKVDGTLNKRDDQDKGWTAEIAIPLGDVNGLDTAGVKVPPVLGATWRLNMYRLDTPEGKPQIAAGWSAPMVGDFHALDRFGEIVFAARSCSPTRTVSFRRQPWGAPRRPRARRATPTWPIPPPRKPRRPIVKRRSRRRWAGSRSRRPRPAFK
jgi:hypothetical protein